MKIGMTIPFMEPGWDRDSIRQWCEVIDKGPWASLALGERINFVNPEFMTTLSACAAWTERVELISTICVATMHNPVLLAKQFATIDVISGGRLTVGVGVGGRKEDYDAVGADWGQRTLGQLQQRVETMQQVWRGEKVVDSALRIVEPLPLQPGGPSILCGAIGPKSIARAATYTAGLSGFSFTADLNEIRQGFEQFRGAWAEAGRPGQPRLVASFWYGLEARGEQQMRDHLQRYLNFMPAELVSALLPEAGFSGSMAQLKDFISEIAALGADDIILVPTSKELAEIQALEKALY